MSLLRKGFGIIVTAFLLLLIVVGQSQAAPAEGKYFTIDAGRTTVLKHREIELVVPVGAADQQIYIGQGDGNLEGIAKPYGFKAVGTPYRFGPHGLKFAKGKELKVSLRVDKGLIPKGYSFRDLELYYINREESRLEQVPGQLLDSANNILIAKLTHFSDYTVGVTSSWDGNGINPFIDYVHNGEESVALYNLKPTIVSKVISLEGRGMNLSLDRVLRSYPHDTNERDLNTFRINDRWCWSILCWEPTLPPPDHDDTYPDKNKDKGCLHMPGGASYSTRHKIGEIYIEGRKFLLYDEGIIFAVNGSTCYLSDGTKMVASHDSNHCLTSEIITDPNGNQIKLYFTGHHVQDDGEDYYWSRLRLIVDSSGREFLIKDGKVDQELSDGSLKTICNCIPGTSNDEHIFKNALGLTTKYCYSSDSLSIYYPNGLRSIYNITHGSKGLFFLGNGNERIIQKYYHPAQNNPFRTISYISKKSDSIPYATISTSVINDVNRKVYFFEYLDNTRFSKLTHIEETYKLTGELIKRSTYNHKYSNYTVPEQFIPRPEWVKTELYKPDGTLGSSALYQYEYDQWGNTTRVIDPYGTETRMAYLNTESNLNLAQYNSQYQNYIFTNPLTVGWNRLATKAALVTDPVHNTTQLRQTHYQYDAKGNLLRESTVYNGSYLNTDYTYDSYGNLLSKTDANGNQLNFEYSSTYQSAYLTRVYKPDNSTIANFTYDIDLGKKVTATDPKGNLFRYNYDLIGRLTKEWLDNTDANIGVAWALTYDDANSILNMSYGSDSGGWQEGKIEYDPLFGKPKVLWRKLNGDWVKTKEFNYDTEGRVSTELDNLGHTVTHTYDELDREIRTIAPDGAVTTRAWDDRTLTITDANGNQRTQNFDLLDRLTEAREYPDANTIYTTTYAYDNFDDPDTQDQDSHLVKVTNPRNAAMIYTYDNLGRLTRTDYPQDGTNPMTAETYTYDNVGNLLTKTDAKGTKTLQYEYFAGYRLKQTTEPDGRIIVNTYDNNDNLVTQTSPGGTYSYTYDARNRVTNLASQLDSNTFNFNYGYDVFGRVRSLTYPNRTNPVTYQYDELDRLQNISDFVSSCGYDGDNKLTEMVLANGMKNTYSYDLNDRPSQIGASSVGSLSSLNYTYDPVGNITRLNDDRFEYDGLNRLTWSGNLPQNQVSSPWGRGTAWSYDGAGNRTGQTKYLNGQLQESLAYTYDLANRLVGAGTAAYENNAAGARTSKTQGADVWSYLYDGESRLTQIQKNGTGLITNTYDGSGMRTKKVANDKTIYYVYSGANPILEYDSDTNKYTYYIYAGSKSIAEEVDGNKTFYHRDHLGSTRATTDQSGKIKGLCKYDAWGKLESTNEYDEGVVNGDFELATNAGVVLNWLAGDSDCTYVSGSGQNGSHALQISRTAGTSYWFLPNVYASPDTDYELSGYFYSGNEASISAKVKIVYYDATGAVIVSDETPLLGYSNGWKVFSLTSHSPALAVTMEVQLTQGSESGQVVYFDGIKLKIPGLAGKYDFTGKKEDEGTGLKYFGARFYDFDSGRFLTLDPDGQEFNWYTYCFNNPINKIDPDGKWVESAIDAGFLAMDVNDIAHNPTDGWAWASLGADIVCTVAPIATGGRLAVKGLEYAVDAAKGSVWAQGAVRRGQIIEKMLGGMGNNFPVIDKFVQGANGFAKSVTSIKSMNLNAKSYQKANAVYNKIMKDVKALAGFGTTTFGDIEVQVNKQTKKVLEVAVPKGAATADQTRQIERATHDAKELGIEVTTKEID